VKRLAREGLCLALAALLTWWIFLRPAREELGVARLEPVAVLQMELTPLTEASALPPASIGASAPSPAPSSPLPMGVDAAPAGAALPAEAPVAEAAPPPPESGTPEGKEEGDAPPSARAPPEEDPVPPEVAERAAEAVLGAPAGSSPPTEPARLPDSVPERGPAGPRPASELMNDPGLLAAAGAELTGEERRGFTTVFLAAPEDQLALAHYFGEELVLVPRATIDPGAADPRWFRVDGARIEEVHGRPPLERYRQYRDLFDYEYARLPELVRELRLRLPARRDVYVFAALVPAREWAIVVARRAEALARAGRELADVQRFVLRYVPLAGGAFDVVVDHVLFADGSRHPDLVAHEKGARSR